MRRDSAWSTSSSALPHASVLVSGVEDHGTGAHGPDESLHLDDLARACLADALLLETLRACPECARLG